LRRKIVEAAWKGVGFVVRSAPPPSSGGSDRCWRRSSITEHLLDKALQAGGRPRGRTHELSAGVPVEAIASEALKAELRAPAPLDYDPQAAGPGDRPAVQARDPNHEELDRPAEPLPRSDLKASRGSKAAGKTALWSSAGETLSPVRPSVLIP
jgi:hypothetical protein